VLQLGGTGATVECRAVAVTSSGRIYATGWYTAPFRPVIHCALHPGSSCSAGTSTASSILAPTSQGEDAFVMAMSSAGEPLWLLSVGGAGNDRGQALAVSSDGTIFVSGRFRDTATFGAFMLTTVTGAGYQQIGSSFVMGVSPAGEVVWVAPCRAGDAMALSPLDTIFLTGCLEDENGVCDTWMGAMALSARNDVGWRPAGVGEVGLDTPPPVLKGRGACRTSDGREGAYTQSRSSALACRLRCEQMSTCVAYELGVDELGVDDEFAPLLDCRLFDMEAITRAVPVEGEERMCFLKEGECSQDAWMEAHRLCNANASTNDDASACLGGTMQSFCHLASACHPNWSVDPSDDNFCFAIDPRCHGVCNDARRCLSSPLGEAHWRDRGRSRGRSLSHACGGAPYTAYCSCMVALLSPSPPPPPPSAPPPLPWVPSPLPWSPPAPPQSLPPLHTPLQPPLASPPAMSVEGLLLMLAALVFLVTGAFLLRIAPDRQKVASTVLATVHDGRISC
jgi:hypothetical protein